MVDISSQNNKVNITVSSSGNTTNVNATPDYTKYYSDKSKEWAIGEKLIDNEDYSSKYYANESKKQADISTAKTTEVVESGNNAVSNIESARDNAITDITNQENVSVDNVNTAGAAQVALATNQASIATQQATIATNKASEVVASGNEALSNIDTAKSSAITDITDLKNNSISSVETARSGALTDIEALHSSSVDDITGLKNTSITDITTAKDNAITSITNQETTSKNNIIDEGTTQVNLAKEQVTFAKEQATIATTQASIATSKTTEVIESGNTALSSIETAKSNALNDINTTGAEYVNNAEQYAQNALNSATNAKTSEDNALSYKNSAMESSQTATEQASIAVTNANKAITSATNAKTSETNAKSSEIRCEEILSRLGTAIKIKGRVNSLDDLPLSGNLDGDAYLVGEEGLDSYPEYYWYKDHWEFLGTTGTSLSWGLISGDITSQNDLMDKLNTKQNVLTAGTGIDITNNVISNTQTSAEWGNIQGTIANQKDLQSALDSKQDKGNYALKSEIPTKTSQLTNDSGFINDDSTFVHKSGNETIAGTKTFSSTISGSVNGSAESSKFLGNHNEIASSNTANPPSSGMAKTSGLFLTGTYNDSATPASYGNIINIAGSGTGQLLCEWSGTDSTTGNVYYRSHRDTSTGGWGTWKKLAFTTDNVSSATKATQDDNGNNIVNTYATKTSLDTKADTSLSNITNAGKQIIKTVSQEGLNNPYSLFDSKYSDHELNNLSWLKSEGQWNAKAVYTDAYDKLLKVYNGTETFEGLSVKLSTETYTDYDFVLNTAEETFRLPLKTKLASGKAVVGNGMALGLTDGTNNLGLRGGLYVSTPIFNASTLIYGANVGTATDESISSNGKTVGITTDPTKSGIELSDSDLYLYFYVGETVQNANLIDAGRIGEQLVDKIGRQDCKAYITETYVNGTSGYRLYSDKWCEQWGRGTLNEIATTTITLLKAYKDTNYSVSAVSITASTASDTEAGLQCTPKSATQITLTAHYINPNSQTACWETKGYLA